MDTSEKDFERTLSRLHEVERQLSLRDVEDVIRDARNAGDHWASRYEPWLGTKTAVSKTVVLVIPNRARNTDLVPYPIWSHWVYRSAIIMEKYFEGTTWYWPALGTYCDKDDPKRQRHLDNSLILESVAPVSELRESRAVDELIALSKDMTISMDQCSILFIAGSIRTLTKNPRKNIVPEPIMPNYYIAESKSYQSQPPGDTTQESISDDQYLSRWIGQRKDYFDQDNPDKAVAMDARKHLLLFRDIYENACNCDVNKWPEMTHKYAKLSEWIKELTETGADLSAFTLVSKSDKEEHQKFSKFRGKFKKKWSENASIV